MSVELGNPCIACGACCAHYSVVFYWAEADDATPGGVPAELTEQVRDLYRAMRGTRDVPPRCVALAGEVGKAVHCTIYPLRSSVCRSFQASWADGQPNERCDRARAAFGMRPLTLDDYRPVEDPTDPDIPTPTPRPLRPAA